MQPFYSFSFLHSVLMITKTLKVGDVEGLTVAATKHLELLKQNDEAESSFIIEKMVGKLLRTQNTRPFPLYLPPARFQWMRVLLTL